MKQKTERGIQRKISNFFGSFGYLFCFLQWFWVIMLYFSVIQSITLLTVPDSHQPVEHAPNLTIAAPSLSQVIVLAAVTTLMIAITVYIFIKIPMGIVKTSNKIVHKSADSMAPFVIKAQHKKDTKKFHMKVTARLMLIMKLLLVLIPIGLTIGSRLLEKQSVDYSIAMVIGCGLACLALVCFILQYLLAQVLHVKIQDLW